MSGSDKPNPVLEYSIDHERTSVLAIVAIIVSILAFPISILLPVFTRTGTMRMPTSAGEVIAEFLKTALPLAIAEILSVRSLVVVMRSRRTARPLKGQSLAIAAVIFSTTWLILLAVAAFANL